MRYHSDGTCADDDPPDADSIYLSEDRLRAGASPRGGFSKAQLAALGITWPPPRGWKDAAVGRWIPEADYAEFLRQRQPAPRSC